MHMDSSPEDLDMTVGEVSAARLFGDRASSRTRPWRGGGRHQWLRSDFLKGKIGKKFFTQYTQAQLLFTNCEYYVDKF